MKLKIDNLDRSGPRDYSDRLDAAHPVKVARKLNEGSTMDAWLVAEAGQIAVPREGAKIVLARDDGSTIFSGYLAGAPRQEFAGYGAVGNVFRYQLPARGEEALLDRSALPPRPAPAGKTAGQMLKAITEDAAPGQFDTSGVADIGTLGPMTLQAGVHWSELAKQIAGSVRAQWRVESGAVQLSPVGAILHTLSEVDGDFTPAALEVWQSASVANDVAIVGDNEPGRYVKDYFVGDNVTLHFAMSSQPFLRVGATIVEEEYAGTSLSPQWWTVADDNGSLSVSGGKLRMNGRSQASGRAWVCPAEQLELGCGLVLEHGAVTVSGDGVVGGLYGADPSGTCLAGFAVSSQSGTLQATINGSATGPAVTMQAGHRYALRTRVFSAEVYRAGQVYRSSAGEHEAAAAGVSSVRFVLELQDIDPANPASQVAPAQVLFDDVVANVPALATYAVVNGARLAGEVSYTRLRHTAAAEVRVAPAGGSAQTQVLGLLNEGAQCEITAAPAAYFYTPYKPATGTEIVVRYRSVGHAACRINDPASIAAHANGSDDGVRAGMWRIAWPEARTQQDCEAAALAILDDSVTTPWEGTYVTWSDFLPGARVAQTATDVYPGDGVHVDAPQRGVSMDAVVREVSLEVLDPANDRAQYTLKFSNDAAAAIAVERGKVQAKQVATLTAASRTAVAAEVPSLPNAEATAIAGTSVTIDAGTEAVPGGGFEVRSGGDWGWGTATDRNLQGRFTSRSFTLPKCERGQDYYLRMYDGATPPNYSRRTTLLHVDVKP